MNLEVIIPVLYGVVIINIILSAIIFSRGLKKLYNVIFALMSLSVALWSFAIIGFYTEGLSDSFNWVALSHSSALFSALVLLYFSITFPSKIIINKWFQIIPALLFLVMVYLIFYTKWVLGDVEGVRYVINHGYIFYQVLLIIYFIESYFALYLQYCKTTEINTRQQVRYIFIGAVCASSFAMMTNLIFPSINIFEYTWLGPIFTLSLVASIFIAILKYHLFNIKIIVTELICLLLIVGLAVELFAESNPGFLVIKALILILTTILSYLLIRGVYHEIELRKKNEALAKDLEFANRGLESINTRLEELDQMKSEFLSLATHQIRAPLTAVKGYASLILEGDYGEVSDGVRNAVKIIGQSCENLVVIVNEFLDISRIEQGRMKYTLKDFDMKVVVAQILEELKPNIEHAGLSYEFHADEGEYIVNADQGKLRQVVGNLIDNAIKYTPTGGMSVNIRKEGNAVHFSIKDTGIGISAEDIPKLFNKFTRTKDGNKQNVIGTGLGLYVAKQMIEAQGGKIWIESEGVGKGTTFIVELPQKI